MALARLLRRSVSVDANKMWGWIHAFFQWRSSRRGNQRRSQTAATGSGPAAAEEHQHAETTEQCSARLWHGGVVEVDVVAILEEAE